MDARDILKIVLRETTAIGQAWRMDWSGFDGRYLRDQLNEIKEFADRASFSDIPIDCTVGTEFYKEHVKDFTS